MNIEDDPNYDIMPAVRSELATLRARVAELEKEKLRTVDEICDYAHTIATQEARIKELEKALQLYTGKKAPVQGFSGGIPWDMHLRAYDAYSKKWSPQPALIDLEGRNCRGGFGTEELDMFIPGWRDELEKRRVASLALAEQKGEG